MGYTVFKKPKPRNENLTKKPVFRQPSEVRQSRINNCLA